MTSAAAFLILAAAITILAAVVGVVVIAMRARVLPGPSLAGKTVVVITRQPDAVSVRGVLVAQHADRLILREAVYLEVGGEVAAAGLIHLPLAGVSSMQELAPAAA